MYCSIYQAVEVYDDLRSAYEGDASHGNEAQIYAYRLLPNDPQMIRGQDYKKDPVDLRRASQSLGEIIDMFKERYNEAKILIEGINYKTWLKKYGHEFDHRVHVKVIAPKDKKK